MIFILSFYNEWNESMRSWSSGAATTGALMSAVLLSIPSLSLFDPVFSSILGNSQYELVTGVEWANQNNRNAIFRVENIVIIELLGVLVCMITFSSLF